MVMMFLVSGDGQGSGKTYLAESLVGPHNVWSIASAMRLELAKEYPDINWFRKDQAYKDNTTVDAYKRGFTVREVMIEYGQEKAKHQKCYWVDRLIDRLNHGHGIASGSLLAIDDIRKVEELNALKLRTKCSGFLHLHVENPDAKPEPMFDNPVLRNLADYVVSWKK